MFRDLLTADIVIEELHTSEWRYRDAPLFILPCQVAPAVG